MIRRTLAILAAALAIAASPAVAAAQAKPTEQKPAPTPSKDAPAVVGKWNVIVNSPNGNVESTLDLKADPKDAKKITGTIASQMGEAALTGEYVDGKLTFAFSMDAGGQQLNVTFTGALQKDGSLAGTLSFGQGEMNWTGTRAK
jgi:hypothetical protein